MTPITAAQISELQAAALDFPALNEVLQHLHECLKAQWAGDCMGAADEAAKACYDFAEQATLFEGLKE